MTIRIGINGFGRIGRNIFRAIYERCHSDFEVVAINDLAPPATLAHLLKYDSVHGKFPKNVQLDGENLIIGEQSTIVFSERDIQNIDWKNVDIVMECTGIFRSKNDSTLHLSSGAKKVLISAPSPDVEKTIVYGVNHDILTHTDRLVSNGSCTTNALAPVAKVLNSVFGIDAGFVTTIHAYTGDQPTLDSVHKDLYRARAAALSMIPTSTGAAKAIAKVIPELEGKLKGQAVRVPTPNVSAIDFTATLKRKASVEEINSALRTASNSYLNGVLNVIDEPLVSCDFNHNPSSTSVAMDQTSVIEESHLIRVLAWYDNEWGFSNRMLDTAKAMYAAK